LILVFGRGLNKIFALLGRYVACVSS